MVTYVAIWALNIHILVAFVQMSCRWRWEQKRKWLFQTKVENVKRKKNKNEDQEIHFFQEKIYIMCHNEDWHLCNKTTKDVETSCFNFHLRQVHWELLRNDEVLFILTLTGRSVSEWGLGGNAGSWIHDRGKYLSTAERKNADLPLKSQLQKCNAFISFWLPWQ